MGCESINLGANQYSQAGCQALNPPPQGAVCVQCTDEISTFPATVAAPLGIRDLRLEEEDYVCEGGKSTAA